MTASQEKILASFKEEFEKKVVANPKQFGLAYQNVLSIYCGLTGDHAAGKKELEAFKTLLNINKPRVLSDGVTKEARKLTQEEWVERNGNTQSSCASCPNYVAPNEGSAPAEVTPMISKTSELANLEAITDNEFWAVINEDATMFEVAKLMSEQRFDMKVSGTVKTKEGLKNYIQKQLQ